MTAGRRAGRAFGGEGRYSSGRPPPVLPRATPGPADGGALQAANRAAPGAPGDRNVCPARATPNTGGVGGARKFEHLSPLQLPTCEILDLRLQTNMPLKMDPSQHPSSCVPKSEDFHPYNISAVTSPSPTFISGLITLRRVAISQPHFCLQPLSYRATVPTSISWTKMLRTFHK